MVCQLGLDCIMLSNAWKLPRDCFGLNLLRKPETLWGQLIEELTISSDVSLPDVVVTGKSGHSWRMIWTDESGDDVWGDEGDPTNGRRRARGCTIVILAITAPGVPRRRRMVWARMPRKARQPLLPAAHSAAPILPHSIDNAAITAVYNRRSPLLH